MFWRLGFPHRSPIDGLLDNEDCTIQQILDEEEVLQECKSKNEKLMNFLTRKENLRTLIEYITIEENGDDEKRTIKYPSVACDVLCSEAPAITLAIVEDEELMDLAFKFLDNPEPLNQNLAGYFVRFCMALYQRRSAEFIAYIQKNNDKFPKRFLDHLGSSGMNDLMLRMMGCEQEEGESPFGSAIDLSFAGQLKLRSMDKSNDNNNQVNSEEVAKWWIENNIISSLVDKFDASQSQEVHINVSSVLSEIIRRTNPQKSNLLANAVNSEEVVKQLFSKILTTTEPSVLLEGVSLLSVIADANIRITEGKQFVSVDELPSAIKVIHSHLKDFTNILANPPPLQPIVSTFGTLNPPLGAARLKIVEFFLSLFHARFAPIEQEILDSHCLNIIIDLFFQFDMNNMLHNFVDEIIRIILSGSNGDMKRALLVDCGFLDKTANTFKDNEKIIAQPKGIRKGNLGHLTAISNDINKLAEGQQFIADMLNESKEWANFCKTALAEKNRLESLTLGGSMPLMNNKADSDEEDPLDQFIPDDRGGSLENEDFDEDDDDDDEEEEDDFQDKSKEGLRDPTFDSRGAFSNDFHDEDEMDVKMEDSEDNEQQWIEKQIIDSTTQEGENNNSQQEGENQSNMVVDNEQHQEEETSKPQEEEEEDDDTNHTKNSSESNQDNHKFNHPTWSAEAQEEDVTDDPDDPRG